MSDINNIYKRTLCVSDQVQGAAAVRAVRPGRPGVLHVHRVPRARYQQFIHGQRRLQPGWIIGRLKQIYNNTLFN